MGKIVYTYRIKPEMQKGSGVIAIIGGDPVNLLGWEFTRTRQKAGYPPYEQKVRAANEKDLRELYESSGDWSWLIEKEIKDDRSKVTDGAESIGSGSGKKKSKVTRGIHSDDESDSGSRN